MLTLARVPALRSLPVLLVLSTVLLAAPVAFAGTFTVTKTADTNDGTCDADCSLREAIVAANANAGADTVVFAGSLAGQTFPLTGTLDLSGEVVVEGDGTITISGSGFASPFLIRAGAEVELIGLTVANGDNDDDPNRGGAITNLGTLTLTSCTVHSSNAGEWEGGGIYNRTGATLHLVDSTVRNNTAFFGAGISNSGTLTMAASTVRDNRADFGGGGLTNYGSATITRSTFSGNDAFLDSGGIYTQGPLTLSGVTITDNFGFFDGGGIYQSSVGMAQVSNSIVAGNRRNGGTSEADCGGSPALILSAGHNVTGVGTGCSFSGTGDATIPPGDVFSLVLDPALTDNGGPTLTHVLIDDAQNPAIDIGGSCGPVDQRGLPAPTDGDGDGTGDCDAGAVERGTVPDVDLRLVVAFDPVLVPAEGGPFPFTALVVNTTDAPQTVDAWSEATLPNGSVRGPLFGPVTVTIAPGDTLSRELVQTVPAGAPAGDYVYTGFVGDFPNAPTDTSSFRVRKAAARGAGEAVVTAWSVVDAATGEAVTAETRWTSDEVPVAGSSAAVPTAFALEAAYPNPFRSATTLSLDLPEDARVRLTVYDVLGRSVATLVDGALEAGSHAAAFDGSALPSGVYLVRMEAGTFTAMQRVTLIR